MRVTEERTETVSVSLRLKHKKPVGKLCRGKTAQFLKDWSRAASIKGLEKYFKGLKCARKLPWEAHTGTARSAGRPGQRWPEKRPDGQDCPAHTAKLCTPSTAEPLGVLRLPVYREMTAPEEEKTKGKGQRERCREKGITSGKKASGLNTIWNVNWNVMFPEVFYERWHITLPWLCRHTELRLLMDLFRDWR